MKTSTRLSELDRKYIVAALKMFDSRERLTIWERLLIGGLIKKINSGIRYDRPTIKTASNR